MKLVGGDSGRYEHEEIVEEVLVTPSERVVVDVHFAEPGELALEHRTPDRTYRLAEIRVEGDYDGSAAASTFADLRTNADMAAERDRVEPYLTAAPDKTLAFVAEMTMEEPEGPTTYVCPMHPEVTSDTPDRCPKCGMKPVPEGSPADGHGHGHEHGDGHEHGHHAEPHAHDAAQGIEWEDDMVEVNRLTTPAMRWKLVDRSTGAENAAIDWQLRVGDQVKIRLVNELDFDHPMPHLFHIHGAGRFLILARDGVTEPNSCGRTPCWCARARSSTSSRRHELRRLDGALPHRRAPRGRDDVQLQRHLRSRRRAVSRDGPEAPRAQTEHGLVTTGEGWFVLNAREAGWLHAEGRSAICEPEGDSTSSRSGSTSPSSAGSPHGHVPLGGRSGGLPRPRRRGAPRRRGGGEAARQWDFVHCPPETKHVVVGAGDGPCVLLAVGGRAHATTGWGGCSVDETARRHGASVEHETSDAREAYAGLSAARRPRTARAGCPTRVGSCQGSRHRARRARSMLAAEVGRLEELGLLTKGEDGLFPPASVHVVRLMAAFEDAGSRPTTSRGASPRAS